MVHVYGWWDYSERGQPEMINQATGERIRYVGPTERTYAGDATSWLSFEYMSADLRFPLVAELTAGTHAPRGSRGGPVQGHLLSVNYDRSAAAWRQESNATEKFPPYGIWRRVDNCATDALACWPTLPDVSVSITQLIMRGGWLNGAWNSNFVRYFTIPGEKNRQDVSRDNTLRADGSLLFPLDTPAPSPWRFHDLAPDEAVDGATDMELPANIILAGLKKLPPDGRVVVPAGEPLTGFEGRTAYMHSEDGKSVVIPRSGTEMSQDRSRPVFSFRYADEDYFVTFRGRNNSPAPLANWNVELWGLVGGSRHGGNETGLRLTMKGPLITADPNYTLWRRLSAAVIDAMLFWKGTTARNSEWMPELTLTGVASVKVYGCYLGGIWPNGEYCAARIEDQGR